MPINGRNYWIITGGPGAGKTSLIEALRARGYRCVDEVGRAIIREQRATGGNALHTGDRKKYFDLMLTRSILGYEEASGAEGPVFFDRGIPELTGYGRLSGFELPDRVREAVGSHPYARDVFVAPPWPEIYRHDEERKQSFSEAVEICELCVAAYVEAGYRTVELPKASVAGRVAFILGLVAADGT